VDYRDLAPDKVRVGNVDTWRIAWDDRHKARSASFKAKREATDFLKDLQDLSGRDPRVALGGTWGCDGEFTFKVSAKGRTRGQERTALTAADIDRIRAGVPRGRDWSLVCMVVFSMDSGLEAIALGDARKRVDDGQHLMMLALLDDVSPGFLASWAKSQSPAKALTGYDGRPEHPVVKLRRAEGEEVDRILAEGLLSKNQDRSFSPATLRMIGIARSSSDLRYLPAVPEEFADCVDWNVVNAAVVTELDIGMFRPVEPNGSEDRDWHWDGVSGLPMGPLTDLQIYGSNLDGRWQGLSHTLGCQHRRRQFDDRYTAGDQMMPLSRYVQLTSEGRCSKCGGLSVRRPTAVQLAYYNDMNMLAEALQAVSIAGRTGLNSIPGGLKDETKRAEVMETLARIEQTWGPRRYRDPLSSADEGRLIELLTEVRRRAGAIAEMARSDGKGADVLSFSRTSGSR
jgi:hypothetical protein